MNTAWEKVQSAVTVQELRAAVIEELRVRAWQETAFMERLAKSKKERESRQHAARALENLAADLERIGTEYRSLADQNEYAAG